MNRKPGFIKDLLWAYNHPQYENKLKRVNRLFDKRLDKINVKSRTAFHDWKSAKDKAVLNNDPALKEGLEGAAKHTDNVLQGLLNSKKDIASKSSNFNDNFGLFSDKHTKGVQDSQKAYAKLALGVGGAGAIGYQMTKESSLIKTAYTDGFKQALKLLIE